MAKPRIVELSHRIIPGEEHFQLETRIDDVTNILPEVKHRADVWYVLGAVTYCTHVGTHIEVPFHHLKEGDDVAQFPVSKLVGPLVVLDFRQKKDQEAITLEEIKAHDAKVHEGDIVFIRTGADKLYRTPRWNEQPHLTVEANLRYGQCRKSRRPAIDFHRVIDVLEIGGLLRRHPRNLSGGEKQRVALGRALLSGPELLLMDEPLASLDAPLKTRVLAYLERVVAEWDIPALFVTHSQAEVRRASQWVVVLQTGRVIGTGTPEDALGQPEPLGWTNATGPMNLLRLDRVEATAGEVRGWIGQQFLRLPPQPPGPTPSFVQFSPTEVILSRQDISGVSARNHLRGQVRRIAHSNRAVFVGIDIGQIIWAEITPAAAGELELSPGVEVICLIKTHCLGFVE